jgi:hypothetical protein
LLRHEWKILYNAANRLDHYAGTGTPGDANLVAERRDGMTQDIETDADITDARRRESSG